MLNMDYYDRNGNKWSIEKGDWLSHQAEYQPAKNFSIRTTFKGLVLFILLTLFVVSCLISLA